MGVIVNLSCPGCDYESDELFLGIPPYPEEHDPVLTSCRSCHELRVVHRPEANKGCPSCSGPLTAENEDRDVRCPRCGESLERENVGLWD